MPTSGSGTGTPVGGGGAPVPTDLLQQPLPLTILSLSSYAKVMGITPAHFWGVTAPDLAPQVFPTKVCESIWFQYAWQDADKISRTDVAIEIARAEEEIARALGYFPGPVWIDGERHDYPGVYRRDYYGTGLNARGDIKAIRADWGRIIEVGKRKADIVAYASVAGGGLVYSDEDSDGFYETATVAVETTLTDINQIKVYHTGYEGDPRWEIRQPRRKYFSSGYVYLIFDSWLFVDPAEYEFMPTEDEAVGVNMSTTDSLVTQVDVYREYPDMTDEQSMFYWQNESVGCGECGGTGCEACGYVTQDGCMSIKNASEGLLIPKPASYDSDDDEWDAEDWSGYREPDFVNLYYRCGEQSREYLATRDPNPVPWDLARAVAYLATARMERPLCGCTNVEALSRHLQQDMTRTEPGTAFVLATNEQANNPFGTRRGEVEAWRMIAKNVRRRSNVAVI